MKILRWLDQNFENVISTVMFSVFIICTFLQVLFRFIFNFSLSWTEEMARYTFIYMVYFAVALAAQQGTHVRVEIIDEIVPKKYMKYILCFTELVSAAFLFIIALSSVEYANKLISMNQITPALQLMYGYVYWIVPGGLFLTTFRFLQRIVRRLTGKITEG